MVTQMIGVGEATGAMDTMLQKIADFYEDEVDAATQDMLAMLEPVIIGILGRARRRHRDFAVHAAVRHDREVGGLVQGEAGGRSLRAHGRPATDVLPGMTAGFRLAVTLDTWRKDPGFDMQSTFDERNWLAWLVKVRIIILTFLLGIELAVARLTANRSAAALLRQRHAAVVCPLAVSTSCCFLSGTSSVFSRCCRW